MLTGRDPVVLLSVLVLCLQISATEATEGSWSSFEEEILKSTRSSTECGVVPLRRQRRVVGGVAVPKCSLPWMVHITRDPDGDDMCGGTLVSDRHVITAAHCFDDVKESYKPVLTFNDNFHLPHVWFPGDVFTSDYNITVHPHYIRITYAYDVAILTLQRPLPLDKLNCVRPICLPGPDDQLPLGSRCSVAGWGSVLRESGHARASVVLMQAGVWVVDQQICMTKFNGRYQNGTQICAGDLSGASDACVGDSGGPLVCSEDTIKVGCGFSTEYPSTAGCDKEKHYLTGVISAGASPCAQAGTPAIYTDVIKARDWIESVMQGV